MCGVRRPIGPTERISIATAPCFAARDAPDRSVLDGLAVPGIGHVEHDDAALHVGRAALEFVEARDDDGIGVDALRRGRRRCHRGRGRTSGRVDGIEQLEALLAAHPLRHHHRFRAHVLETVLPHRRGRPAMAASRFCRPAQARAEGVGQHRQALPRVVVGRGRLRSISWRRPDTVPASRASGRRGRPRTTTRRHPQRTRSTRRTPTGHDPCERAPSDD